MAKMRRIPAIGFLSRLGLLAALATPLAAQAGTTVSGRVTILERDGRAAGDAAQAVVWLSGETAPPGVPSRVEMATEDKQFVPRLLVLAEGSTVEFPNHDPFNHNVFSLAPEATFDLGLYGRGEAKSVAFPRPGVIRVYCNVHAKMRGLVVLLPSALHTQPGADGGFRLEAVPPGDYILHAWHERGGEVNQPLKVTSEPQSPVALSIDARGYRFVQHKDKNGQSYSDRGRRHDPSRRY